MTDKLKAIWIILTTNNWLIIGDSKHFPETMYLPDGLVAQRISKNELYIHQDRAN